MADEELPRSGRGGGVFAEEIFGEFFSGLLEMVPLLDEAAAREETLEAGHIFGRHLRSEQLELGRGGIGIDAEHEQANVDLVQLLEAFGVGSGRGPGSVERLHPAFSVEGAEGFERVFLVGDFLELVAAGEGRNLLHEAFGFGVLIASFGALIHFPAGTRGEADGAQHAGGVLDKAVVAGEAKMAGLDVGESVEGIEQEAPGTFVEGNGHRVCGKVAAAEIFKDGRPVVDGLAGLGIFLTAGAGDFNADAAGEPEEEGAGGLVIAPEGAASFLQRFLELESISLN